MTFLGLAGGWSLQILVVGACAEAFAPLLGRAHPRVRASYWSLVLALVVVAPWLFSLGTGAAAVAPGSVLVVASNAVGRTLGSVGPSGQTVVLVAWAAVALLLLLRLATGLRRLSAIARDSRPLGLPDEPEARVHETDRVLSPASSFIGRVILVPPGFGALPETWRKAAVTHEMIHLSRGHGVLLVLEEVLLSLFWFHPVVFRIVRRVRDSREEMVDAETIESIGAPSDYRDMLIGLAARLTLPAPAVSGTTALRARIESLLSLEENPMPRISRLRLIIPGVALLSTAALVAHAAPLQTSGGATAETEKAKAAQPPRKVISRVNPVYPAALKEKKIAGLVQVVITVDSSGTVTNAVARPDDNPELAKAAIDAIKQWRFEPGSGNVKMTHTIQFRLDSDKK